MWGNRFKGIIAETVPLKFKAQVKFLSELMFCSKLASCIHFLSFIVSLISAFSLLTVKRKESEKDGKEVWDHYYLFPPFFASNIIKKGKEKRSKYFSGVSIIGEQFFKYNYILR